ncbi:methionine-rich copper-binding protein CopC [Caulobacter ginsengisoli]|uniref:Methionine-rich copper-binding protein CopC n=1 Tax=Caulobacter ginsengisoli TaxID=400775 RepID=A0ABU0IRE0_9CAUL|nr:copper homeostasis periplasmic binding protein CopC [Caulobacter ginsengisoli]MDQ0464591.1 methionine-rich copper-binding protein CopC [Caulobacter ginsengisoli]
MKAPYLALAAALVMAAPPAWAHPALVASTPAAGATVSGVRQIELRFSEPLVAKLSSASLVATKMDMGEGMMDHRMGMGGTVRFDPADAKVMRLVFKGPLPAGVYHLDWKAVSTDTHHLKGGFDFTVR